MAELLFEFGRLQHILGALLFVHLLLFVFWQRDDLRRNAESAFLESLAVGSPLTNIEFHGIHDAPATIGNVLFFSWKDANSATVQYSYVPVKRKLIGDWRVGYAGSCSQDGEKQARMEFASFQAHYLWLPYDYNSMTEVSIVCGHINRQTIQTVSVIWQDGTITSDEVKEGRFVLFAAGRIAACQLQLFDSSNTLVEEIDLRQIDFVSTDATTTLPHCR
jgi:hypothetical protein